MKVKHLVAVCVIMAAFLAAGCAPAKAPGAPSGAKAPAGAKAPSGYEIIRMIGSTVGSRNTTIVMVFAALFNKYYPEIEWSSSSGATGTNPIYITKGQVKVAMAGPGNYIDAYGFDKIRESRLRSISNPTPLNQYVFLVPEDKPWKDITEVPKGLTLCPGSPGTTIPVVAEAWLKLVGLSKKDFNWVPLGKGELADAWRAGKVDLALTTAAGVEPLFMDIQTSPRKFKIMGMTPEQAAKAKAEQMFERIGFEAPVKGNLSEIAPELFKYDVICPQQPQMLLSRDDFPDDVAYRMAKIIDEHNAELAQLFAPMKYGTPQWHIQWAKPPLDIHPGVAKYYKEKGYLK